MWQQAAKLLLLHKEHKADKPVLGNVWARWTMQLGLCASPNTLGQGQLLKTSQQSSHIETHSKNTYSFHIDVIAM